MLQRALGQRRDETAQALREAPADRVRECRRPLEPGAPHELDRLADDGMSREVEPAELIAVDAQRREHRRIELPHRPPAELLDPVVDRPHALHRAVGDPLREPPVALVEAGRGRRERAVGVGVLLEDAADDLVRGQPRGRDHRTPRRNSS